MDRLDFSNRELTDQYYKEKFTSDLSHYFVVEGWKELNNIKDFQIDTSTRIANLYIRGRNQSDGYPAVAVEGGSEQDNKRQNFEFSGMFAYMYITTKCIRKHCGDEKAFLFCKEYVFPLIDDKQALDDFDVIATLKEAGIAPYYFEAENYLAMMNHVMPYMKEQTAAFIERLAPEVAEERDRHIAYLHDWVSTTQDQYLSFYCLPVRKEPMPEGNPYPAKYYLLQPLRKYARHFGVCSLDELAKLFNTKIRGDITEFDGPIVPHYEDLEYLKEFHQDYYYVLFSAITEQEKRVLHLLDTVSDFMWDDEPYRKNGKTGLKDCWGRVIASPKYEDCRGMSGEAFDDGGFLVDPQVCILVKDNGKWAMVRRNNELERVTDYSFDEVNPPYDGYYVTRIDNKYGLFTQSGIELLTTSMDDIYQPILDGEQLIWESEHIMYKKDGKYGILYGNGTHTRQLLDEFASEYGHHLSVRVGNEWGYLDKDGCFTRERKNAYVQSNKYRPDSMATYCHKTNNKDINHDEYMVELMKHISYVCARLSVNIDLYGSCLEGKAEIRMGSRKRVLYYHLLPDGPTFCVGMQRPYQLKLYDDRYHDMKQSWDGYEKEKELLKTWLNDTNKKTGVRNWAELAYEFNMDNESRPLSVSYAYRKCIDAEKTSPSEIEHYDFPRIEFQ